MQAMSTGCFFVKEFTMCSNCDIIALVNFLE